jgi:hypothetical protein
LRQAPSSGQAAAKEKERIAAACATGAAGRTMVRVARATMGMRRFDIFRWRFWRVLLLVPRNMIVFVL